MVNFHLNKLYNTANIVIFLYVLLWFYGWINFSIYDLFVLNLFDPAAENYHFYNVYNFKKIFLTNNFDDLTHGNFTIYPHLLERLTLLFFKEDFFPKARILTVLSFYFLIFLLFFISVYLTKNITFSLLILTIFYGWNSHIIYFQMYKPDIFYLLFGFISIFILILFKKKFINIIFSSLFLSLSIYSKQTGIIFIFINFFTLLYLHFNFYEKKSILRFIKVILIYFLFFISYSFTIFYFIDYNSLTSSLRGLQGYSNKDNLDHFLFHLKYYFLYGYFIGPLVILIYIFFEKNINFKFYLLCLMIIVHLFSFNLWNNEGAFSNNFIIISSLSTFLIIILFKEIKNINYKNLIIIIIFLNSLHFIGVVKGNINFGYHNEVTNSNLLKLVKNIDKDDQILSYNYSFINFIKNLETEVQYDSIVSLLKYNKYEDINTSFFKTINKQNIKSLKNIINSIDNKIAKKEYKFILFSNIEMNNIHKGISKFYYLDETIYSNFGNFRNIPVYVYKPLKY